MSQKRLRLQVPLLTTLFTLLPRVAFAWEVKTVFGLTIDNSNGQALGSLIDQVLVIAYSLSGGLALLMIVYGAFRYIVSAGDPKGNQEAKDIIQSAFTGLVLVLIAYLIADFLGGPSLTSPNI